MSAVEGSGYFLLGWEGRGKASISLLKMDWNNAK